jgi:hypothetical protein
MKVLKIAGLIAVGIFVLAALLVGAAFIPAVQTWMVRKAVARQPGFTFEIGRVAVGLSTAEICDLRLVQDGVIVTAKRVFARYSVWDYLAHKQVNVDRIEIQELGVDVRQMSATAVTTAPQITGPAVVFAPRAIVGFGVFHLAGLPPDFRLASLAADGRVVLSGCRAVGFTLQGGGIEPGRRGQLAWKIDCSDPGKGAPMSALRAEGSMSLYITTDRRNDLIELENLAAVDVAEVPSNSLRLDLQAEQAVSEQDKVYTARLSLLRNPTAEPIFELRVASTADARKSNGTGQVAVPNPFGAKAPAPYMLTGSVNIPAFDVGAFLRLANPNAAPALEAEMRIAARLDGRSATLPGLLQNVHGELDVAGAGGTLRVLGIKGRQTAGIASAGLRLLGAVTGSDSASALGELTGYLNEMPFDQFTMHVNRGADMNLNLTSLEFISTDMRLTGHGTIQHQNGVSIAEQPLHVEMQLAGKDHLAFLLGKTNLLDGQQDDKGYSVMSSPFVIGGTPAKPDSSQLWRIVGSAAASAGAPSVAKALQGLFGR